METQPKKYTFSRRLEDSLVWSAHFVEDISSKRCQTRASFPGKVSDAGDARLTGQPPEPRLWRILHRIPPNARRSCEHQPKKAAGDECKTAKATPPREPSKPLHVWAAASKTHMLASTFEG